MSANRNSAHRHSLPVNTSEHSHILRQERLRVGDDIRNRDDISSLRGHDNDSENRARACKPQTAIFHRIDEDTDGLEGRNPSDEDATPPSLTDVIKWNKIEEMKMSFYQEMILKDNVSGYNSDITNQTGKKEVKKIVWRRGRSYSCSYKANAFPHELELNTGSGEVQLCLRTDDDVENINASTRCVKLPSIFENNVTNSRQSASASHANIKHVHYTSDDKSHLNKRRKQNSVGMQDTLLDEELRSKVKEFLQKPQPKASLPSLRITEKIPDVQLHVKGKGSNYNTDLTEQSMRVPINTETCPLISHFKDRKWYYQDKSGKCRYLRVPESPIPPVSFVFSKD